VKLSKHIFGVALIVGSFAAVRAAGHPAAASTSGKMLPNPAPVVAGGAIPTKGLFVTDPATAGILIFRKRTWKEIGSFSYGFERGIWTDQTGNVYVASASCSSCNTGGVGEFPPGSDTPQYTYAAGQGYVPFNVTTDDRGHVYIAYEATGSGNAFVGEYEQGGSTPIASYRMSSFAVGGIAVDDHRDLFVVDSGGVLVEFPRGSTTPRQLGITFNTSYGGLAIDRDRNLIGCNQGSPSSGQSAVVVIAPPYRRVKKFIFGFTTPQSVAFNARESELFVADSGPPYLPGSVYVLTYPSGSLVTQISGLKKPFGVAFSPNSL
jgi:hypothetical protein